VTGRPVKSSGSDRPDLANLEYGVTEIDIICAWSQMAARRLLPLRPEYLYFLYL